MLWLSALGLSWLWQAFARDAPRPEPDLDLVQVVARNEAGETTTGEIELAWRSWGADHRQAERLPVVLLHGSPGSHRDFATLAPALGAQRLVLAPDLPGFGASSLDPPSLSIAAQAAAVADLLAKLEIPRAHVLGFSMGGGVGLELATREPQRLASLILLSSLGVEELELLGDHELNHSIHLLALGATRGVDLLVPHFGAFDHFPLGVPWARQFAETDQRRLRAALESWSGPALIVHGRHDVLVPFAAAEESARLLPQAELVALEVDHFAVFGSGAELALKIEPFLDQVEQGTAPSREQASPERQLAAAQPWDPASTPPAQGFAVALAGILLALATLVSEDLASITGGLLASQGRLPYWVVVVACGAGIFFGDVLLFLAGRTLGRAAVRRRPLSWLIDAKRLESAGVWFKRHGPTVILASRFTPGTRLATYVTAGLLRTPWWSFLGWFALSVALWTPLLVGAAMMAGGRLERILERGLLALVVVALLLVVVIRALVVPALTHRGRRRLVGRWRRWTRWEFWPAWLVYPPIVIWILLLGLRYRRPTLFTAVNPSFPNASGFVGESKSTILGLLPAADPRVPAWTKIPPSLVDERLRLLEAFRHQHHLALPIVLKPDVGERGAGVRICSSLDEAVAALTEEPRALIAQEYLPGVEVGAFWMRRPPRSGVVEQGGEQGGEQEGERKGELFALTEKVVPVVIGDGVRTTEELVYDDPRAVILADLYLDNLGPRCHQVPAAGEVVRLAELGTHCRGAIFLDGARLITPELAAAVDELSSQIPGFHFGRWDLRAPSLEALARGEVRVVELNGITSEATVIYDPSYSLFDGWRLLARQWSLAFEIGAANAAAGAPVTSVVELARLVWRSRHRAQ